MALEGNSWCGPSERRSGSIGAAFASTALRITLCSERITRTPVTKDAARLTHTTFGTLRLQRYQKRLALNPTL